MTFHREIDKNIRWEIVGVEEELALQGLVQPLLQKVQTGTFPSLGRNEVNVRQFSNGCCFEFRKPAGEIILTRNSEGKVAIMVRFQEKKKKWRKYLEELNSVIL